MLCQSGCDFPIGFLGLDKSHGAVHKAAERYLNLIRDDGDFWNHMSCLTGYNIRTFLMLGYRDDNRLKKSIKLLLNTDKPDGGYLCDMHEGKYKTRAVKSCYRGSLKVLSAFSLLSEYWGHERCIKLVDYFLKREGIFKSTRPHEYVTREISNLSFPITWQANLFELLLASGRMGFGTDKRLSRAWKLLRSKRDKSGKYLLEWTPGQSPWNAGKRGQVNKWITFYALMAEKWRGNI